MTKEELQQKIEELQKQIDELKNVKIEEKPKKWKPERGETYYCVDAGGEVNFFRFDNDEFDNGCISVGNCFQTRGEAQFVADKIKYTQMFKRYVEEHSEPLDWENGRQEKWRMVYNFYCHRINVDYESYYMHQGTIYASSKKILEDAIGYIGEDNVKKYVLEVEE